MSKDFVATIHNPERAAEWQVVYGDTAVHIKSPIPKTADLPGKPNALIYELDLELLSPEQRQRLIEHLAAKFNVPIQQVVAGIDTVGVPILADDVTVTVHNPQRWL